MWNFDILKYLRGERNDLHEVFRAKFAGDRSEDTSSARVVGSIDDDHRIAIKTEVTAVGATDGRFGPDDNRLGNFTF